MQQNYAQAQQDAQQQSAKPIQETIEDLKQKFTKKLAIFKGRKDDLIDHDRSSVMGSKLNTSMNTKTKGNSELKELKTQIKKEIVNHK